MVIGVSGLISPLVADKVVMGIGISVLIVASAILFINGLAKQVMRWEGMIMLLLFGFFIIKLIGYIQ